MVMKQEKRQQPTVYLLKTSLAAVAISCPTDLPRDGPVSSAT